MIHLSGIADRTLVIGQEIERVRKMTPVEAGYFGWSERPAILVLANGTMVLPSRGLGAEEGGMFWSHEPLLWPAPSFSRIESGRPKEGAWLVGETIRDLRPLGRRDLGRFGWDGDTPVSALIVDKATIVVPSRSELWAEGPGELVVVDRGSAFMVLPHGPKDWQPH